MKNAKSSRHKAALCDAAEKKIITKELMSSMNFQILILIIIVIAIAAFKRRQFETGRKQRRDYYRNDYLKSDVWKRKRYVVLKRDNWRCVYCGGRATQVHHKKYAKYNIGKEPIEWLVSVCTSCHDAQHRNNTQKTTKNIEST
ncbi:MAG: hypothetical protein IPH18_06055 [Chitinophagaceae bacterium]|nr:hypothetical protein [Chitinophagaceae bacterium]